MVIQGHSQDEILGACAVTRIFMWTKVIGNERINTKTEQRMASRPSYA